MSRPGTACRPRPSSSSLLPRLHPSLSPIGHAPRRPPVTRLTTVHVRICLCLKYMSLSLARLYASHTGVAIGSGGAAQPGATGRACHTSKVISISIPIYICNYIYIHPSIYLLIYIFNLSLNLYLYLYLYLYTIRMCKAMLKSTLHSTVVCAGWTRWRGH